MTSRLVVSEPEDIEDAVSEAVSVHEDPPQGVNPNDDDDPHLGEDGILTVEPDQIEIEGDFGREEFPEKESFPVDFLGWDHTEEREAAVHGLQTHEPADVTITLEKSWTEKRGKSVGLYRVQAEH